ncbi:MAG: hypothetical protein U0791_20610 [Gemmataceae bacterium]
MSRLLFASAVLLLPSAARADDPAKVFEERIAPIFKSPNPSSCAQCHLAAVDLKDYILPSAKDTFLALRDQGLIDLERPETSKILTFIERGKNDPRANLIPAKQRQAEYDAFAAWIKACAADPALKNAPKSDKKLDVKPVEVVRHARRDRMIDSFESNVWSLRFRCMNCHTEGTPQNDKLRKEHGDGVAWFKKGGPAATMDYLLASKLINWDDAEKSLLLTKPLGTVKHGGGIKFAPGDQGYKAMRAWIDDVIAIKKGTYAKPADLPLKEKFVSHGTEIWFKLQNTPDAWGDKLLQVNIHAWDEAAKSWEADPIATSDRVVFGKGKLWQHTLTLLAEPGSKRSRMWDRRASLPAGKYLVKVYVDSEGKTKRDWKAKLGDAEFAGQVEVQGRWAEGYGAMTVADGGKVKK